MMTHRWRSVTRDRDKLTSPLPDLFYQVAKIERNVVGVEI